MRLAILAIEVLVACLIVSACAFLIAAFCKDNGIGEWDILTKASLPAMWVLRKGSQWTS